MDKSETPNLQTLGLMIPKFGNDHPKTLTAAAKLALTYKCQHRHRKAEDLAVPPLRTMTRVMGENHLETLGLTSTLARVHAQLGHPEDAKNLLADVISRRKRVQGERHRGIEEDETFLTRCALYGSKIDGSPNIQRDTTLKTRHKNGSD